VVCFHGDTDVLLQNENSEHCHAIDQEIQHTDDFIFCVANFVFCFVPQKISRFIT
jgi:hypothetical protein